MSDTVKIINRNEEEVVRASGSHSGSSLVKKDVLNGENRSTNTVSVKSGSGVKQKRRLLAQFHKLIAEEAEGLQGDLRMKLNAYSRFNANQKDAIVMPVDTFQRKLMEKWQEMDMMKWWDEVLCVLEGLGIESGRDLAEWLNDVGKKTRIMYEENLEITELKAKCKALQVELETSKKVAEKTAEQISEVQKEADSLRRTVEQLQEELKEERASVEHVRGTKYERASVIEDEDDRATVVSSEADWLRNGPLFDSIKKDRKGAAKDEENLERRKERERAKNTERRERKTSERVKTSRTDDGTGSPVHAAMSSLAEVMRANALPEPKVFDGFGSLKDFRNTFMNKFGAMVNKDADLGAILEQKFLEGMAKTIFKSLPGLRSKSINELFDDLKKKLDKRLGDKQLHALQEYDGLAKNAKQSMWEYCVQIEKLSRQAYPQASERDLVAHRVVKLTNAVRENENLMNLLMMRRRDVPEEDRYDELKDMVLQHEHNMKDVDSRRRNFRAHNSKKEQEQSENRGDQGEYQESREYSDDVRNTVSKDKSDVKCFNCGRMGHMSFECPTKSINRMSTEERSGRGDSTEWCEILGQRRLFTIDSGAAVSALTTKAWKRLRKGCASWEKQCVTSGAPKFDVRDAQMRVIPVKGQVRTAVHVKGRTAFVTFQILENEQELFLIGTDAFRSLGVELRWFTRKPEVEKTAGRDRVFQNGRKQTVVQKVSLMVKTKSEKKYVENREAVGKQMQTVEQKEHPVVNTQKEQKYAGRRKLKYELNDLNKDVREKAGTECKPKRVNMKPGMVIVMPRMGIQAAAIYEVRRAVLPIFHQKYDDAEVTKVVVVVNITEDRKYNEAARSMIYEFLEHKKEVVIVPGIMECNLHEVQKIYEDWRETFPKVTIVCPWKSSGEQRFPLILNSRMKSNEELANYLVDALEKDEINIRRVCGVSTDGNTAASEKRARFRVNMT